MTIIFSDEFETGDFTQWDGTNSSGQADGYPEVQSGTVKTGTYAAHTLMNNYGTRSFSYKSIDSGAGTPRLTAYARCYVRYESAPPSGAILMFLRLITVQNRSVYIGVKNDSGTMKFCFIYSNGGSETTVVLDPATLAPSTSTWYCFEVKSFIDSSAGEALGYIDGTKYFDYTGLNNSSDTRLFQFQCGIITTSGTGTKETYWDTAVCADSYIGPESSGQQLFTLINEMGY